MNCQEIQAALDAEPRTRDATVAVHIERCAECADYRRQLLDMDRLIERALAIPVDVSSPCTPAQLGRTRATAFGSWRIAASLVASVAVVATILLASTHESLAEQVAAHAAQEPAMLEGAHERADADRVQGILAKDGLGLRTDALHVSRIASCPFRGREVPHLVVQTEQGPVTVLVLAHEKAAKSAKRFEEEGFEGVIVPAPRGVLAILGQGISVEGAAEQVLAALEYR
jgi:hypothetical protein